MSQIIRHYQTSFVVDNDKQTAANKLYQAQRVIGEWVKAHERERFARLKRDKTSSFLIDGNFTHRAHYKSKYSWCKTDYCLEEDSTAWAIQYTHRDNKIRDVFWVSDIGLRAFNESGRLVVNVQISYKVSTEHALTGEPYEPSVSIPWCVEALLKRFKGSRFFSGEQDVTEGIGRAITINDVDQASRIISYVESEDRKLAVVLLHGETKDTHEEADYLSKNLFGKALVYIVPYKVEIKKVLARFRLEFNECLFVPNFRVHKDLGRKLRYFVTNQKALEKTHQILLHSWLGYHPINERGAVSDVENVQLLIRRRKFFKLAELIQKSVPAAEYEKMKTQLKDMSGLFELSEAEKKELEEKAGQLEDRVGELEIQNLDLQIKKDELEDKHAAEVYNIKATQESLMRKSAENVCVLPREYPGSFSALKAFAPFYKHLAFAEKAWDPALAYRNFKDFEIAWKMLHDLDQKLWEIVFVKRGDIEHEFESSTVFEYAKGEGAQTTNNARLVQMRRFEFEGKQYEMWPHLKYGNKPGKQLRIHFAFDNDRQRIIVGYIGEHMDNATTRTMH